MTRAAAIPGAAFAFILAFAASASPSESVVCSSRPCITPALQTSGRWAGALVFSAPPPAFSLLLTGDVALASPESTALTARGRS